VINQSFIGDMWKCAMHIKNRLIDNGEKQVQIGSIYLDNKFTYFVVFPIVNYKDSVAVLKLDNMIKNRDIYEKDFNVKCEYILTNDDDNTSFYGVCIQ